MTWVPVILIVIMLRTGLVSAFHSSALMVRRAAAARLPAPDSGLFRSVVCPTRRPTAAVRAFSGRSDGDDPNPTKAATKTEREARKEAKAAAHAAKAEAKAAAAASAEAAAEALARMPVSFLALNDPATVAFGDYERFASQGKSGRTFTAIADLAPAPAGSAASPSPSLPPLVWLRCRVQAVRATGSACFLVLRQGAFSTVQAVLFKDKSSPEAAKATSAMIKWLAALPAETVVDLEGVPVAAAVKACSRGDVEVAVQRCFAVSRPTLTLPFSVEDASRPEREVEASQLTERPFPRLGQDLRLNNRCVS